jgi:predicted transcriptional regulator
MNVTTQKLDIIHKERSAHRPDWWNMLPAEEQASIEQGLADAANGKLTSHAEVKKRYEHWLDN